MWALTVFWAQSTFCLLPKHVLKGERVMDKKQQLLVASVTGLLVAGMSVAAMAGTAATASMMEKTKGSCHSKSSCNSPNGCGAKAKSAEKTNAQ
jgi:hypothetical protein